MYLSIDNKKGGLTLARNKQRPKTLKGSGTKQREERERKKKSASRKSSWSDVVITAGSIMFRFDASASFRRQLDRYACLVWNITLFFRLHRFRLFANRCVGWLVAVNAERERRGSYLGLSSVQLGDIDINGSFTHNGWLRLAMYLVGMCVYSISDWKPLLHAQARSKKQICVGFFSLLSPPPPLLLLRSFLPSCWDGLQKLLSCLGFLSNPVKLSSSHLGRKVFGCAWCEQTS